MDLVDLDRQEFKKSNTQDVIPQQDRKRRKKLEIPPISYNLTNRNQGKGKSVMSTEIDVSSLPWDQAGVAMKTAHITGKFVPEGFELTTVMDDGHTETKNIAGPGGAFLATNPGGEQYLIKPEKLEKLYDLQPAGDYRPKPEEISFLVAPMDVHFEAPWGEMMYIKSGGALVNRGGGDIYGIQPKEFNDTYTVNVEPSPILPDEVPLKNSTFEDGPSPF